MTLIELGVALGSPGSGTVARWIGSDDAPAMTVLACEALRARHGEKKKIGREIYCLSLPSAAPDQTAAVVRAFVAALGGSMVHVPMKGESA